MAVSKRLRFEIFRRDNHACRYCGRAAPDVTLTVDHVVPTALGGGDEPANLVTACSDCNAGKSSVPAGAPLIADVEQDALRWANAIKLAREQAMLARDAQMEIEKKVWFWLEQYSRYMPAGWFDTVGQFLAAGLDPEEVIEAAMIADGARHISWSSKWRYFCGICWKRVEKRREQAAAIVAAQGPAPSAHLGFGE